MVLKQRICIKSLNDFIEILKNRYLFEAVKKSPATFRGCINTVKLRDIFERAEKERQTYKITQPKKTQSAKKPENIFDFFDYVIALT